MRKVFRKTIARKIVKIERTSAESRIDNRVMYSIGAAARVSGLLNADVVFGIPLSATSKNIFFDRK